MLNTTGLTNKVFLTKDLINDQSWDHLHKKLNTAGTDFDVTEGLGATNGSSTMVLISAGGFDDQKIKADLKYVAATTAGSEDIGVMLRLITNESSDSTYYYARVSSGFARITSVVDSSFTNLSSAAFALAQDDVVTITFQAVGNQLTAKFESGGSPTTVTLTATDNSIPAGGLVGFRSLSSTIYCRNFTVEQL